MAHLFKISSIISTMLLMAVASAGQAAYGTSPPHFNPAQQQTSQSIPQYIPPSSSVPSQNMTPVTVPQYSYPSQAPTYESSQSYPSQNMTPIPAPPHAYPAQAPYVPSQSFPSQNMAPVTFPQYASPSKPMSYQQCPSCPQYGCPSQPRPYQECPSCPQYGCPAKPMSYQQCPSCPQYGCPSQPRQPFQQCPSCPQYASPSQPMPYQQGPVYSMPQWQPPAPPSFGLQIPQYAPAQMPPAPQQPPCPSTCHCIKPCRCPPPCQCGVTQPYSNSWFSLASCPSPCDYRVTGSLIYWTAFERDLDCDCTPVLIKDRFDSHGNLISIIDGNRRNLEFDWNAGFRIGLEYNLSCLTFGAFWTHINPKGRGKHDDSHDISDSSSSHIKGSSGNSNSFTTVTGSSSSNGIGNACDRHTRWHMNFDVLDVIVGRGICIDPCLEFTPFVGLRGAWINQKLKSTKCGRWISDETTFCITGHRHDRESFSGAGPELGFEADWNVGCGFDVFGNVGGAILFGPYKIRGKDIDIIGPNKTIRGDHDNFTTGLPVVDAAIGVRWDKQFGCATFLAEIGLEHHRYINYNLLGHGDLCLNGVTFTAGIAY